MATWFSGLNNRDTYVTHTGQFPNATDGNAIREGSFLIDEDTGVTYTFNNGTWVIDKNTYNGNKYNSNGELINLSDTYYNKTITIEDINTKYFRQGFVYGAGYTWSTVISGSIINLHLFTGAKPIYMEYSVAGVGLSEYGVVRNITITTGNYGTELAVLNRNESMGNNPTTKIYRDATYTGGVVEIPRFLGTGGNINQRSGGTGGSQAAILTPNSHFIFSLKNAGSVTQERMGIYIDWFEITV